jgi:type II secretory pathway pseudopilin PulG
MSIISLLSSVVFASVQESQAKARDVAKISTAGEVKKALILFRENEGFLPGDPQAGGGDYIGQKVEEGTGDYNTVMGQLVPDYLPEIPDSSDDSYRYINNGSGSSSGAVFEISLENENNIGSAGGGEDSIVGIYELTVTGPEVVGGDDIYDLSWKIDTSDSAGVRYTISNYNASKKIWEAIAKTPYTIVMNANIPGIEPERALALVASPYIVGESGEVGTCLNYPIYVLSNNSYSTGSNLSCKFLFPLNCRSVSINPCPTISPSLDFLIEVGLTDMCNETDKICTSVSY